MERTAARRPPADDPAPQPRRPVADPLVGRLLDGRYQVDRRIARGGMATVYQGVDTRLERPVAIKVMHPGLGEDESFARRFRREARSVARLSHPGIVSVFDQGEADGTLYLVMEYVPGVTLRELCRDQAPLSPARALAILDGVLSALAMAHQAGLVHRDVKPENVLLSDDGTVKVADFGLVRAVNAETQHTGTSDVLIGTVSYLSPELVVGGTGDARCDVYAAGVLLYEMLTGEKPHQGDSPIQVAYKHVHEDIPSPSRRTAGVPAYVDEVVLHATARDPRRRPADAAAMLAEVRHARRSLRHGTVPLRLADQDTDDDLAGGYDNDDERTTDLPHQRRQLVERIAPAGPAAGLLADEDDEAPPRRRRRGRWVALLLVLLLAGAGWYYEVARYTATPGVLGLSRTAARTALSKDGLTMHLTGRGYSETVAKGMVMATDPGPGGRVLKHGNVGVELSLGPERHAVPHLAGLQAGAAAAQLRADRLTAGRQLGRWSDTVPAGQVVTTAPAQGTELRRNTAVDLVVSRGPKPVHVPDVTGDSVGAATATLRHLGLKVTTSRRYDDNVPAGQVIDQSPGAGNGHRGDSVSLSVSRGPRMVSVPSVRGMGVADAKARLEQLGFHVTTAPSSMYLGLGYAVSTDPSAGSSAPYGSTITIVLV